jgi:hypothetical protein
MKEAANLGGLQSGLGPSPSRRLICKSFNYELKRVRGFAADCINLFLGRRIQESFCFVDAIECDHDQAVRRSAIYAGEFLAANDVMTARSLKFFSRHRSICDAGLERGSVIYFQNGNYEIRRRLHLGMKSLDSCSADSYAYDERKSYLVFRFHGVLPE